MIPLVGKNWNIFRYLGDFTHLLSICILVYSMIKKRSSSGISIKTQYLYLIVYLCRYVNPHLFRPPLYNIFFKFFYMISTGVIILLMKTRLKRSYDKRHDNFVIFIPLIACIPFALLSTENYELEEILWTYSLCLESVAILPQLFLLQRTQRVNVLTQEYIFFLGSYRFFYICNWIRKHIKHGYKTPILNWATGIIQTLLYADFIYYYIKSKIKGTSMQLPF